MKQIMKTIAALCLCILPMEMSAQTLADFQKAMEQYDYETVVNRITDDSYCPNTISTNSMTARIVEPLVSASSFAIVRKGNERG